MKIPFKYNLRNLFVRKATTLMTMVSIAFVVLVFIGVFSLGAGLERAFSVTGDPDNLLVLRDGARSETESGFPMDVFREVAALPGVEQGPDGPLASGELVVLQIFERRDGSESNVTVRGIMTTTRDVRPDFKVVEGREFEPGRGEIIVGDNLAERFPGLALGSTVKFGRIDFQVVGVFTAAGASLESEVLGAVEDIGNAFNRSNAVSSIRLRTSSKASADSLKAAVEGDQRFRLKVMPETQYYAEQTDASTLQIKLLGTLMAVLMGFGACFAAANTMYSQISARSRELGTLRAIGFRRSHTFFSVILESAVLGFFGGILGALMSIPLNGLSAGTTNFVTFSEITFELTLTWPVVLMGIALAVATGIIGGLLPAFTASFRQITGLLREA